MTGWFGGLRGEPLTHPTSFRWAVWSALALVLLLASCVPDVAHADSIPHAALRYRADLTRNARLIWGLDAPVATFAGQIHQESGWRPEAESKYAAGLAQFTPDTAKWICGAYPALSRGQGPEARDQGPACDVFNPAWAIRALVTYDKHLWQRIAARDDCNRMAMTLSAYNGGFGWLTRDIRAASAAGADPLTWFGSVEQFNAGRALWAVRENRAYPKSILRRWSPLYAARGWGLSVCA